MKTALSKREKQVLKMLLAEYSVSEISEILNLHVNTVCGAKQRVMEKWEVNTMVALVLEAIKRGYLEPEEEPAVKFAGALPDKNNQNHRFHWVTDVA